jgi:putative tryptophan/tyrosine transport system substrate-binding protein
VKRRTFFSLLGGAALAWPLTARAQPAGRPRRIGFLMGYSENSPQARIAVSAFDEGLKNVGLRAGRDIQIDYRWAGGDVEKTRAFARELIALEPDLIVASTNQVVSIVKAETRTIPIIFVFIGDPIGSGYAASLALPGANLTGFANFEGPIGGKWLELIKEASPATQRVGFVIHPAVSAHLEFLQAARASAPAFGFAVVPIEVTNAQEVEDRIGAFGSTADKGAIVVPPHALTLAQRNVIVGLATRYQLPGVFGDRSFAEIGGLISFGINMADQLRRVATYVDVILKGAKPAELPVQLPTNYEMLVNLKTAKALGLAIPATMLARADEVLE